MSDHEHVAIRDGDRMVCTHCGVELFLRSPWENPKNWGGMSLDDYHKECRWVPADVTNEDQEKGL